MGKSWTKEQLDAITTTECNLLVSAAAGAGKTAVLVERIIRLLCDAASPLDIDRLLVVTFTEAAAAEMRERIASALEKEIRQSGRVELARQLSLVNGAPISTLHAFCLDVIRRYFYVVDLDPAFRVADDSEATLLQQDTLDEVLEEALSSDDVHVLALAARYGGKKGDEGLARQILRLYRFAWSNPNPVVWLAQAAANFQPEEPSTPEDSLSLWLPAVKNHLRLTLAHAASFLERAQALCRQPGGPLIYERLLESERQQLQSLDSLIDGTWEALREAWLGTAFDRLPAAKDVDEDLKALAQKMRNKAKDAITEAAESYFTRSAAEYQMEVDELAPLVSSLCQLVERFAHMYGVRKKQAGLADFNDLEHYCLQILAKGNPQELIPSAAAQELRRRFSYVLVDEYQDINPVQDAILTLVSRQGEEIPNLFMVGDVKQSIYRFRLGDPGLFLERYRRYPTQPGGLDRRILLSKNFRCRSGVVTAVNFLFRQLMSAEVMEIAYDNDAELVCGANYPEPGELQTLTEPVEVHLLERQPAAEDEVEDAAEDLEVLEQETVIVAQRILEMVQNKQEPLHVFDKDTECYRPVGYRDIVILLRATTNRANRVADILGRFGIPAYADLSTGYFAATEVEIMLALLQVVDNPCQDIPLAAVLRSPFVGLTVEELAAIRMAGGKNNDFYAAVIEAVSADIPGLSPKLSQFLKNLDNWRTLARREKLASFIATVYRESGYADYVAGLPDGAQRQANLRALFSRARQFDRFSRQGLFRFLDFIAQLRRSGDDLGAARALGENEDVVRIISIHKSKGLEFPVVFLCDLGKGFNFQDQRAEILIHRYFGIGPLLVDTEAKLRYPSLPYLALKLAGEAETRAEEMRILYVALTRAREKLILIGSARGLHDELDNWQRLLSHCHNQLPPADVARARNYLDWLGRALARHHDINGQQTYLTWLEGESSRFSLTLWDGETNIIPKIPQQEEMSTSLRDAILSLQPVPLDLPEKEREAIQQCLSYRYPNRLTGVPVKLSVSEIKRRFSQQDEDDVQTPLFSPHSWASPSFLAKKSGLTAAERGTLYHRVFQHLDLTFAPDKQGVISQLNLLAKEGIFSQEDLQQIDPALITPFFSTDAGRLVLAHSDQTYREWPFTLALPASELTKEANPDETVIIQGIIDLLVKTPQGYVIVDYKTDSIPPGGLPELVNRYKEQLNYYARAVETILCEPVYATYLYSLTRGQVLTYVTNSNLQ